MAKQGFATSDRRKVENLTAAAHTVKVHDCGTVFTLNLNLAQVITLPSIQACGEGWWARFVLQTAKNGGQHAFIDIDAADGLNAGPNKDWTLLAVGADGNGSATWTVDDTGGGRTNDRIKLDATNDAVGDYVEIMVLNGNWVAHGYSAV